MSESTWLRIRKYIDDHRNQAVYASVFLILLFIGGFWWYLLQIGQVPMAYAGVAGSVFIDENMDGVFDGTEFGFPGVLLRLISEVGDEVTAVSDSSGVYGFNVLPGSYTLSMEEEPGWFSTTPSTVSFTLNENDVVFVDFGSYFETPVDETLYGIVEGVVFRDLNLDGAFDEAEPGMTEVHIGLYDSEGVLVAETLSVEEGLFSFTLLEPGEYTLMETIPEEYFNTTSALVQVTVEADTVVEVLFGLEDESRLDSGDSDAVVYGFVYNDKIRNRMRDASERGIEGVTIEVFDGDESVSSAVTDENGFYVIALGSGSYRVVEHDLPGWESATPNEVDVTLSLGDRAQVNFGDWESPIVEEIPDISGAVFDDQDGDGLRDDGEPGIEGVSVELWRGETMTDETVTNEDGAYSFIDLPLNVYTVKEVQPDGWQSTTPDEVVADLEDGISVVVDFGETKGAVISGTVYNDLNTNGVNNGEDGIPGVTVKLLLSDELVDSVVTDAKGGYGFTVLKAGPYKVVETNLIGYQKSSTPNSVNVNIVSLTGQTVTVDFGDYVYYVPPKPPVEYTGTIKCYVFHDADDDGVWDPEESPVPGVAVDLYRGESKLNTVHTNEVGLADFGKYITGTYKVVETDLLGWVSTTDNTVEFTLSRDEIEEIEFGDRRRTRIMGVVYNDADVDEERDAEEEGIEGVLVELRLGEVLVDDTVTSADGSYVFYVSAAGDYMVEEHDLTGWKSSTLNQMPVSVVEVEEEVHEVDFGDYLPQTGEIWGIAFDDLDGNGENGDEPGIEGVVVSLYDEDGFVADTISDEDGEYWFTELPPGVYEVRADYVTSYFRTTPGSVMPLVEAGDEKQVDFGYVYVENPFGVIYGTVFNDKDGDLGRGFGELGLSGVDVSLWLGEVLVTSETTNEYGCYTIRINTADEYTLVETDLEGWHSTFPPTPPDEYSIPALTSNDNDSPWDFGDTLGATVLGIVWDDEDRDTVKGAEETGIEGVLVELFLGEVLVDDTLTAGDGSYSLLALASGDYTVKETDLVGWESSTPEEVPVSIGELTGQALVDKDFGDYELGKGRITGTVFDDLDGNGVQEDEEGIEGVTVSIYDEEDIFVDSQETDENGEYLFELIIPGKYVVRETNPDGYHSTTSDKVVVDLLEEEEEKVNFGDRDIGAFGGIYGTVWNDEDGDGIREVELGLPDVTVNLYTLEEEENTLIDTKTTNEHGQYTFTDLDIDDYLVEEVNPTGWTSTTPDEVEKSVTEEYLTYEVDYGDIYPNPSISVWKYVIDPLSLTGQQLKSVTVASGTIIKYEFVVGNEGNVPVSNIVLVDDVLGTISLPETTLDPGKAMPGSATHTVTEDIVNTATVTAIYVTPDPDDDDVEVSDESSATVTIGVMELTVTKEVSKDGSTWSDHVDVYIGDTVYYRFTVENTGTLPLTDVSLNDVMNSDPPQSIALLDTELDSGESTTNAGPVTITAVEGENTNTATAKGWYLNFDVTGTDTTSYTATPEPGKIHGTVFHDENQDEDQDSGDYGISGTTIKLWQDTTLIDTTTTDSSGDYEFNDLPPGDYEVEEIDKIGPPYGESSTPNEVEVTLDPGEDEEVNFGDYSDRGQVSGYVYLDEDGNSNHESWEWGISDVVIEIYEGTIEPGETPVDTTTTDWNGDYTFYVHSGSYTVKEIDPSWVAVSTTPNEQSVSVSIYGYNEAIFGDAVEGVVYVYVFHDLDKDGNKDSHEYGIAGVEIEVIDEDNNVESYYTGSDGRLYIELVPGDYTLKEIDPTDYYSTTTNRHDIFVDTYYGMIGPLYFGDSQYTELRIKKQVIDGNGVPQDWGAHVKAGEKFTFKYTFTNTDSETITGLTYYDWNIDTSALPGSVAPGTQSIEVESYSNAYPGWDWGEIWVYKSQYGYLTYGETDWFGEGAEISVYMEIQDADGTYKPDGALVRAGGDAKYHFVIENRGNVRLEDIYLVDDDSVTLFSGISLNPGQKREDLYDTETGVLGPGGRSVTSYGDTPIQTVEDYADASYIGKEVELEITKEVSTDGSTWDPAHVNVAKGGTVYYRITVKNTGEETLTGITLSDSDLWTTDKTYSSLAPDATIVEEEQVTAAEGTMTNTADVSAWWYNIELTGDDSASYFGVDLDYTFSKEVMGFDGWQDVQAYQLTGDPVSYQFVIINDGNVDLTDLEISDPMLDTLNPIIVGTVAAGSQETLGPYTITAVKGSHLNTATLTGDHLLGTVNEVDTATYDADTPEISVTKEVSKDNVNWNTYVEVPVDDTVYFRFTVKNTGDVEVKNLDGYDPDLGQTIEFVDTTLAPGETTVNKYTVSVSAQYGLNENTAEAYADWYGVPAEAEGSASYTGKTMEITVSKMIKDCYGVWREDGAEVVEGALVDFKVTVKNTGEVPLSDVVVSDMMFGSLSPPSLTLQPDEEVTYIRSTTETWPEYNEAWADGYWNGYQTYEDDVLYYEVVEPETGIEVVKEIKDRDGVWYKGIDTISDPVEFFVGDTVTYRFTLTNVGNVNLVDIHADDNVLGAIDLPTTLAAGASAVSDEITRVAEAGLHENTVDVQAYDEVIYDFAWAMDSAYYYAATPDITVTKEVSLDETNWDSYVEVPMGGIVYFRFTLENTGDIELTDVSLTDSSFGVIADGLTLSVGEECEYFKDIIDPVLGLHKNTATATGYWNTLKVKDTDDASYLGYSDAAPSIKVTKKVSKNNVNWCDHVELPEGRTVYFMFTLENTGNVELSDVELHDTTFGFIVDGLTFQPGETATYYYYSTAELSIHVNTATATGQWNDITVESEDEASYKGYPGFVIPEVPLGTVLSLATMLGTAGLFKLKKFRR